MMQKLKQFRERWSEYRHQAQIHQDLDILLSSAAENKSLEDQLQWLVRLLRWIRFEGKSGQAQQARLRLFLMMLDRNPSWKTQVAVTLRGVVAKVSGLELYTEAGLPREWGLWGELADRVMLKVLPPPPLDYDLGALFWALFPHKDDSAWLASLDAETYGRLVELFNYDINPGDEPWSRFDLDILDALNYLVIQVRAIGLSPSVRHRLNDSTMHHSAFFFLGAGIEEFIQAWRQGDEQDLNAKAGALRTMVQNCGDELAQVHNHLDEHGVSINLVFQMMRLRIYLQRIESLLEILLTDKSDHRKVVVFLAKLVEENQELRSIRSLLSQNVALFARKIAERAAETGEHYISRTKEEYRHMLQAAGGGGALTAITVYVKQGVVSLGLPGFVEGFLASVNYAVSFVAIQLSGFTLGTKQPAMTAPALAEKMRDLESEEGRGLLVAEIVHLVRSQVASILGNLMMVVPVALLINFIWFWLFDGHIMTPEKARYAVASTDILGPAVLYAGFTGILLWISSIFAGWADNWYALNCLRRTLARSPALCALFGKRGARGIALFLEKNISGLVGNISLGFLLGLTPEVMRFLGVPLDVRHVTLSSGTLAAALPALGFDFVQTWDFWRSIMGIFFIGAFNVGVSFTLALLTAIKARGVRPSQQIALRREVLSFFFQHPLSFFLPVGTVMGTKISEAKDVETDKK